MCKMFGLLIVLRFNSVHVCMESSAFLVLLLNSSLLIFADSINFRIIHYGMYGSRKLIDQNPP